MALNLHSVDVQKPKEMKTKNSTFPPFKSVIISCRVHCYVCAWAAVVVEPFPGATAAVSHLKVLYCHWWEIKGLFGNHLSSAHRSATDGIDAHGAPLVRLQGPSRIREKLEKQSNFWNLLLPFLERFSGSTFRPCRGTVGGIFDYNMSQSCILLKKFVINSSNRSDAMQLSPLKRIRSQL